MLSRSFQRAVAPRVITKLKKPLRSFSTAEATTTTPATTTNPIVAEVKKPSFKQKIANVSEQTTQLASDAANGATQAAINTAKETCQTTRQFIQPVFPLLQRIQNHPNEPYVRLWVTAFTAYYWFRALPQNDYYAPAPAFPVGITHNRYGLDSL